MDFVDFVLKYSFSTPKSVAFLGERDEVFFLPKSQVILYEDNPEKGDFLIVSIKKWLLEKNENLKGSENLYVLG